MDSRFRGNNCEYSPGTREVADIARSFSDAAIPRLQSPFQPGDCFASLAMSTIDADAQEHCFVALDER